MFGLVSLREDGSQWCCHDILGIGDRNVDGGGHAWNDRRVSVHQFDSGGKTLDATSDCRLRGDSFNNTVYNQVGHRFNFNLHLLIFAHAGDISLIDMSQDDEVVQICNLHHFGAATLAARAGNCLADRNRPGQHCTVKGGKNTGLRKFLLREVKIVLGTGTCNLGDLVPGLDVLKSLLRNKTVVEQFFRALVFTLGLLKLEVGAVDLFLAGINFNFQVLVIQSEQ